MFVTFVLIPNMIELFVFILVLFLSCGGMNQMPQTDNCLGGFPGWSLTFEKRKKRKTKRTVYEVNSSVSSLVLYGIY